MRQSKQPSYGQLLIGRLVTSLYMIIDIQTGKTEFKSLFKSLLRSVCHKFPNILLINLDQSRLSYR
jgi:hypothetical protein